MHIKYLIASFSALVLLSCGSKNVADSATTTTEKHKEEANAVTLTEAQFRTAGIKIGSVEQKQISGTFKANGVLDVPPQQMISISIPMGGFLRKTDLLQGMLVRKGQLIGVVENPDYVSMQQDYLDAKSQFEYAESDYIRQQELAKENVNAQKTLQQAKASFESLKAKVNGLKEKIKATGINFSEVEKGNIQSSIYLYAPINGYVTEVNANIGKFVNPADILFEIVDTDHLHAELTVFEKDVPKLKIGQKVRFTLANEVTERTATVYLIGRQISNDRTVRIHCHIDKEDNQLLPGMFLKAIVETANSDVFGLPDAAILSYNDRKYIFIQESVEQNITEKNNQDYHFQMVEIQTGKSDEGYTEVILPADMDWKSIKIVVNGAYSLLSKMKNSDEDGH